MGDTFGLENVLWFANNREDAYEEPTFKRSRAHNYIANEVKGVRNNVGCSEIANFSKHLISGKGARKYLDYISDFRINFTKNWRQK